MCSILFERPRGVVVKVLTCSAEVSRIEITFDQVSKTLSVHPAANGYSNFFRAGEGLGGEEQKMGTTLHMLSPLTQVES